jgi:hypothetical protein
VDEFILDALPRYPPGQRIGNFALSAEYVATHNHDICRNELSAQQRRKADHFRSAVLDLGFDDQKVDIAVGTGVSLGMGAEK